MTNIIKALLLATAFAASASSFAVASNAEPIKVHTSAHSAQSDANKAAERFWEEQRENGA